MNIPQGYKQTELGIIPEDWEVVLLGSGLRFQTGYPFQSSYFNGDGMGVRLIRNRDLKSDDSITHYSGAIYNEFIVNNYDILIGMDGDFMPCVWDKGVALLNQRVGRLVVKNDWSPRFLYYALQEPLKQKEQGTSATTVKHLSHSDIERILMSIPPSKEQRAIAEALSDVDGLIAALDKKIAKKRLLKQGTMQQLLTGKKRLPGFTDEWVEGNIKEYFEITAGGDVDMSRFSSVKTSRCKYPIYSNSLDEKGLYGYTSLPNYSAGCVTITGRGTLGHAEYRDEAFDAIVRLIVMTPKGNNICAQFIKELLNLVEPFIFESTGVPQLTAPQVGSTKIKVPQKIEEQQAIATILSDMDKEITTLEAQRDKYRLLKSGMMQKLLTGQIRLKTE